MDEIPGIDDYVHQLQWRHDELFKEPKEEGDDSGTRDRDSDGPRPE